MMSVRLGLVLMGQGGVPVEGHGGRHGRVDCSIECLAGRYGASLYPESRQPSWDGNVDVMWM
jgi:hypothetical protein